MGEWLTIPSFADDTITHADVWQDIWENLYSLKNPLYAETAISSNAASWSTVSASFVDIDTNYFREIFESYGNDVLVGLLIKHQQSGANFTSPFTLELDGVVQGNTSGGLMAITQFGSLAGDVHQLLYILKNVSAGIHTLDVQYASPGGGSTTTVYGQPNELYKLWVAEFR